ncbi:MAG: hypothetical protein V3U88_10130 [Methylococcales bacterium]
MNMKNKVGLARTAIGLIVISICVYLLLNNTATAVESFSQTLF